MKLTRAQRRLLEEVRDGPRRVGGRRGVAVENLEKLGLVTSRWRTVGGYSTPSTWSITVTITEKGRRELQR